VPPACLTPQRSQFTQGSGAWMCQRGKGISQWCAEFNFWGLIGGTRDPLCQDPVRQFGASGSQQRA